MGVFTRPDSPFYQLFLEGAGLGGRGKKEKTKIRRDAATPEQRKENRQLAEAFYHQRMTQLARGVVLPSEKPAITFNAFADWFAQHKLPKRRGAERERQMLPHLRAAFGPLPLRAIDRHIVDEYMTRRLNTPTVIARKKRTKPRTVQAGESTVNREVDLLKAILKAAVPKYLEVSPLYGMPRLRAATPRRRLMAPEEEARLLAVMAPDDKALFLLGLDSLVRLGDLLDIKREHDEGKQIWIADPKAGGGFNVPVSKRARKALAAIVENGTPYYFSRRRRATTESGRRNAVKQMLQRYCAKAGVPYGRALGGLTFHWATRRTGTTRMLTRGVDVGTVQKVGRWKDPSVVLGIYHELIGDKERAAVESVGRRSRSIPAGKKKANKRR